MMLQNKLINECSHSFILFSKDCLADIWPASDGRRPDIGMLTRSYCTLRPYSARGYISPNIYELGQPAPSTDG